MLMRVSHVQIVLNSRGGFRFPRDPGEHRDKIVAGAGGGMSGHKKNKKLLTYSQK